MISGKTAMRIFDAVWGLVSVLEPMGDFGEGLYALIVKCIQFFYSF